jgi:hypothetical protein
MKIQYFRLHIDFNHVSLRMFSKFIKKRENGTENATILDAFQFNFLLMNTIYILPNVVGNPADHKTVSNRLFIDFVNFRKFVNRSNFDIVVNYFIELIIKILQEHETFELHVNLKSFSITATEKYKNIVLLFYEKYQTNYVNRIDSVYIYHTPSFFDTIKSIFVKLSPLSNTFMFEPVLYNSRESPQKLAEVMKERMESIYNENDIEYDDDNDEEGTF